MSKIAEVISTDGEVQALSDFNSEKEFEYKILNSLGFENIRDFFIKKTIIDAVKEKHKEIVQEANFLYETLTKWGWMDIEFHNRIISRYECLGDLIYTLDAHFYHIGHHENQVGHDVHGFNPNFVSQTFNANGDNWGLGHENLKFNNE